MCNPNSKRPMPDINEQIRGMNLFSSSMTYAFEDKDFTVHTLEALLGMEVTEEMRQEMNVIAERSTKNPDGTRGARFDVLVSFPSKRINIEIQRLQRGDEIQHSRFNMAMMATDINEGINYIPNMTLISLWICDFNPMEGIVGKPLSHYILKPFLMNSEENICLEDEQYIFINGAYDWKKLEGIRPLKKEETRIKNYLFDMRQTEPEMIIDSRTKRAVVKCKTRGTEMYDKIAENLKERWKDFGEQYIAIGEAKGEIKGRTEKTVEDARNLLTLGVAPDIVSKGVGLSIEEVLDIQSQVKTQNLS